MARTENLWFILASKLNEAFRGVWWGWLDLQQKYANKTRKKNNKTKQKNNKWNNRERKENPETYVHSIRPKIRWDSYFQ